MKPANILPLLLMLVCASAQAEDTVESFFGDALLCKTPAIDWQDPATRATLKKLHVRYKDLQKAAMNREQIIFMADQQFIFEKPVRIAGVLVSGVAYKSDSDLTFLADASGDPDALVKRMGLRKTSRSVEKTLRIQYYKYARPPTKDAPYPNAIIVQNGDDKKGHFYFGCRNFFAAD